MDNITQTNFNKYSWHNLTDNGEQQIRWLRDNFDFSKQNLLDVAAPPLRPKIEFNDNYVFIILLFPVYNRRSQTITPSELDIFLNKNFLVTAHKDDINAIKDFAQKIETRPDFGGQYQKSDPLHLCLDILEDTAASLFPMLNHIAWDIDNIDSQLFSGRERELINRTLAIKRNIVDIRKNLRAHGDVMSELKDNYKKYFPGNKIEEQLKIIIKHTGDIWDLLENHKQTIDAIQQTNESLITFRLNQIMKTLTIFSVIVFPLTLLAAIFGMNTVGGMPFVDGRAGFWKVVGIMGLGTMVMFYYFKKHKWL